MLAFALRGIVLVVVLGWYSTSVWKMIDGYFKARFDKYLKDEFAKNPRMKTDIEAHTSVKIKPIEVAGDRDTCQVDSCPVDKAGDEISPAEVLRQEIEEKNDERHNTQENNDKQSKELEKEIESKVETEVHVEMAKVQQRKIVGKVKKKPNELPKTTKKKKLKTLVLTEEDFEDVRKKIRDYDFSEFEYEEQPPEGIPVAKLGYKPKADIGNLDRVTEDEYCPVGLETDCSQTKRWP